MPKALHVDKLGRLVIPVHIRTALGITPDTPLQASLERGRIVVEVCQPLFSQAEVTAVAVRLLARRGVCEEPAAVTNEISEISALLGQREAKAR